MAKEICISSTPHETRLAILEDDQLAEIYYERENEYTLAGSIYKGRVTRVLPGMQSAFVDVGLERDAFLYVTDFLEEQEEDSAEFERVDANGKDRRPRDGRESREPRVRPAEVEPEMQAAEAPAPRRSDREPRQGEAGDDSGTRRWHGRRGRGLRGRGPRQDRPGSERSGSERSGSDRSGSDRSGSERPALDRSIDSPEYVEEATSAEPVALPERGAPGGIAAQNLPIVLPGESLSKYGGRRDKRSEAGSESKGEASPRSTPARPASSFMAKPSTQVEVPTGWDGGAMLPGESLSRHRRSESRPSRASGPTHVPEATASTIDVEEVESNAAVAAVVGVTAEVAEPPVQPETAWSAEPLESAEPEIPAPAYSDFAAAEAQIPTPMDVVVTGSQAAIAESVAAPEAEVVEEVREYEPEEAEASHRVEVPRSELRFSGPIEEEVIEEEESSPEASSARETNGHAEASSAGAEGQAISPEAEVVRQLFGYAPGMGVLEEETIDEEEYDFEPIPGQPDEHGPEEMEEETLDQAATAADAMREVSVEKHLGYGSPAEAEEDEQSDELENGFAEGEEADSEEGEEGEEEFDEASGEGSGEAAAGAEGTAPARREGRRLDRRGGRGRQQGGGRRHGGGRRPNMQTSDLPIISELLKQGQEILVQIAKEPIARKGARITSHIALPGRFLVFMPTVNHVGVSRKIDSDEERQRLKRILISEKGTAGGGFIVRTAAENASEEDLRADIRFLINLWAEIKQRSDNAKAPALIYHDLNLIERILRDQVSDNFATIWVDSESEYERIVRFLNRFQPSLVRRVKLYTKETPLFEQFGIQEEISKALKSKVWLKSGGSIVINQTEALVAIDINTGKYVGKTARLEDTILKTNLDAIPEIVRQVRLRDLGGIIVIDFIDMDERRNRQKVTQALEDALKADRAPSKVLQFNDFGLVAITRKRVKQSLERTLSVPCLTCTGTGMVKSPVTVANEIYTEMRKMLRSFERNDVMLRVHPEVVKVLKAGNGKWLNELEEMTGKTIIVKSDPALPPEQFDIQG
ncbi:MAG TPA: Rne/Rng family ribonuclease [Acidobacteriaceae bacterium]|jgi:ribonuclease G|nr:Rne/Rng family ribonuclease [Acidobacteriaceae bacterium]